MIARSKNDMDVTIIRKDDEVIIRIAKAGHNRAIAKLTLGQAAQIKEFLTHVL